MPEIVRHSQYFEAILQLRNPNDELINFVRNQVKTLKNGVDMYISDQRFTRAMGNKMKKAFKGELKMSRKIFTRNKQTSKDVYRVTVLFRMADDEPKEELD
jgi:NMD protein affecting ribosome stability and mRNA decay